MRKLLFALVCNAAFILGAAGQTTTFNGVVKDLSNTPVPTGKVTFSLRPGIDTTISGSSRFTSNTVTCQILNPSITSTTSTGTTVTVNVGTAQSWVVGDTLVIAGTADAGLNNAVATAYAITVVNSTTSFTFALTGTHNNGAGGTAGGLYANAGTGACQVVQNSAIIPANTSYSVSIWPIFSNITTFNTYAIGAGPVDISTVVPTPGQTPAYSFMDLFSAQTVTGAKTFSNIVSAIITGAATVGGAFTANGGVAVNGGSLPSCTIAASPNGATESGTTVTITTTAACSFALTNNWVNLNGIGPSGGILQYNGPYQVVSGSGGTVFTVTNTKTGLAGSGGGTVTPIPLGVTGGPASDAIINPGTFDNANFYVYSLRQVGGCNYQSAYYNVNGNRRDTTPNANCLLIPAASTQAQGDAVVGVVQNFSGSATAGTAVMGIAECDSVGCRNFAGGFVANDNGFLTSSNLGEETDVGWSNAGGSTSFGKNIVSFGTVAPAPLTAALYIQNNTPGTPANGWGTALRLGPGSSLAPQLNGTTCQAGICFGPLASGNSQASQGIAMVATSSGGSSLLTTWSEDSSGNNQFNSTNAHVFSTGGITRAQVTSSGLFGVGTIGPVTAAGTFLGGGALPFAGIYFGTAATNNFNFAPTATAGSRTINVNDTGGVATVALPLLGSAGTAGYQTKRVASCTTGAAAGSTCTTTVTWTTAFADTNYTATCTIDGPTAVPYVLNTSSKAGASVVVTIANLTAVAASGTINCGAQHD